MDTIFGPSLFYLSYRIQHKILVTTQSYLEARCFEFGHTKVPDLMKQRNWHDAESVELTQWIKAYMQLRKRLSPEIRKHLPKRFSAKIRNATADLCRLVIQRVSVEITDLIYILEAAVDLVNSLNDSDAAAEMMAIKDKIQSSEEDMRRQQVELKDELANELKCIMRQRNELKEKEREAFVKIQALEKSRRSDIIKRLEQALSENTEQCVSNAQTLIVLADEAKEWKGTTDVNNEYS